MSWHHSSLNGFDVCTVLIWYYEKKKQCILWEFESNLTAEDFSSGTSLDEYLPKWGLNKNLDLYTFSWIEGNPMLSKEKMS